MLCVCFFSIYEHYLSFFSVSHLFFSSLSLRYFMRDEGTYQTCKLCLLSDRVMCFCNIFATIRLAKSDIYWKIMWNSFAQSFACFSQIATKIMWVWEDLRPENTHKLSTKLFHFSVHFCINWNSLIHVYYYWKIGQYSQRYLLNAMRWLFFGWIKLCDVFSLWFKI